jgi:hypothetical protein
MQVSAGRLSPPPLLAKFACDTDSLTCHAARLSGCARNPSGNPIELFQPAGPQ